MRKQKCITFTNFSFCSVFVLFSLSFFFVALTASGTDQFRTEKLTGKRFRRCDFVYKDDLIEHII